MLFSKSNILLSTLFTIVCFLTHNNNNNQASALMSNSLKSQHISSINKLSYTTTMHGKLSRSKSTTRLEMWSGDEELEGIDRYKACVPYLLPLLDGEMFGKYIYERIPPLGFLDSLFIGPLYEGYSHVPFLGLIIFISFTLGTRGNTDMSRNLRFNAQQASLIDVLLIAPELIGSAFEGEDIPRYLQEPCMNFVWYAYMSMVLYSIFNNLRGKKPDQLPWISGYAEMMVGPF